ncbi:MAG TPA: SWIM zinc finger family protein [Steroidobacteraceae bacterium]|nr:SWIM zinc finger family protein [Steroidobacteraceae bacterium]
MSGWELYAKPSAYEQRQRAARAAKRLAQRLAAAGRKPSPVLIEGRAIARSFWGKAWCENLEAYRDYEYRLPRGRSYVRNGAVLDLELAAGKIAAVVCGTELYDIDIRIEPVATARWGRIKQLCAGRIGSLIELLDGRLSEHVMRIITQREQGLFPQPAEIEMRCSCPDRATLCKHVAAVLYGVGARLDAQPQLLFMLRQVDQDELIGAAADLGAPRRRGARKTIAAEDLGAVFGIELAQSPRAQVSGRAKATRSSSDSPKPGRKGRRSRSRRR